MYNPLLLTDFYKTGHVFQYPKGIKTVYSNFTPRGSRIDGVDGMVFFGLQHFIVKYLQEMFQDYFFDEDVEFIISEYSRRMKTSLGGDLSSYDHIRDLHALGYLPLRIKALPEGSVVPMRVPCITITNTDEDFAWLPNYIETLMSCSIWLPCTSATIAHELRKDLDQWGRKTGMPAEFIQWQGHDFSMRGMSSPESAINSGMGHLLSFTGTDTIPAIDALEIFYDADADKELIGGSVPATEHSVMCAGGQIDELGTFRRLISEVYPKGIVSIVSDTWDLGRVLTEYLPTLKAEILAREGKVVIRPDSGDPVKILCGDPSKTGWEAKGVVECLWDIVGGTTTSTGHKLLDSHLGSIYGDGINRARLNEICRQLEAKGFASQVVFGIGSYTYQPNTRDTFGTAMKATWAKVGDTAYELFKDPVTDDGTKRSAKGLLKVYTDNGQYKLRDQVTRGEEDSGDLEPVFEDGQMLRYESLQEIRVRLAKERARCVASH